MSYLLFDIGGTKMRFAISRDLKKIGQSEIVDTPQDFFDAMRLITSLTQKLTHGEKIKTAGGGIPGEFTKKGAKLFYSPNLTGWIGKALKDGLEKAIGAPVYYENDATIVGLGEAVSGAGRGFSIVSYITVSTGIGGARIVDGKIDEKSVGWEPGQQIISVPRTLPEVSNPDKTLEGYASGAAISKGFGVRAYEVTNPEVWEILAEQLAVGLHNIILEWSPDILVLGGSMITGRPRIDPVRVSYYLSKILPMYPKTPIIKEATLDTNGGLYGAMEFLRQKIKK